MRNSWHFVCWRIRENKIKCFPRKNHVIDIKSLKKSGIITCFFNIYTYTVFSYSHQIQASLANIFLVSPFILLQSVIFWACFFSETKNVVFLLSAFFTNLLKPITGSMGCMAAVFLYLFLAVVALSSDILRQLTVVSCNFSFRSQEQALHQTFGQIFLAQKYRKVCSVPLIRAAVLYKALAHDLWWLVGSGHRYQILSHVFARCSSRRIYGHARIARRFFDSRNVQKSVIQIIYLGPLPTD